MRHARAFVAAGSVVVAAFLGSLRAQEKSPPAAKKPAADSVEAKFLSNVRRLTHDFVKAGEGYFSPDGKTIIYQAVPQDYPFYQIYTQSLAGRRPRRSS